MSKGREGGRAYLLIAFDLPNQRLLSTEEVVGPLEGECHTVTVDWARLIKLIDDKGVDPPKEPPWKRGPVDDARPKDPPWKRGPVDDAPDGEEERPPEV